MKRSLAIFLAVALGFVTGPVRAQVPDDVAEIEVLRGWRGDDGIHRGALAIQLAPGWKTYWRAAGEGGIPPSFNWSGSGNLDALEVHFPVPQVFDQNGLRSYGYQTRVVLPFRARPSQQGRGIELSGQIELGVCLDVCIPVTFDIAELLPPSGSVGADTIRAAFANRPMTAREAGLGAVTCRIEPIADGLRVTTEIDMRLMSGEMVAVMELPDPSIWISEASVRQHDGRLVATTEMVPPEAAPFFLARDSLRITLLGGGQAVELLGCD